MLIKVKMMKAMSSKSIKGLILNSTLECTDNTGAKEVYIISVFGHKQEKAKS